MAHRPHPLQDAAFFSFRLLAPVYGIAKKHVTTAPQRPYLWRKVAHLANDCWSVRMEKAEPGAGNLAGLEAANAPS